MAELDKTWEELRASLKSYVRTKVDVDVSDDLVHDILLRVLQNEERLSELDNPIAWIYTIAKNRITDHYRKQSTSKATNEIDNLESFAEDAEKMPYNADDKFAECLRPLIDRLEPKYREAILLTDIYETKQARAAKQIGISVSGMKSRVQRARAKLKDELLACCVVEVDRFGKVIDYEKKDDCNEDKCC